MDSIAEVYNFTVANCLNYFVGNSSVLVHNAHTDGILGKMSAALRIRVAALDAEFPGLSAKMLDYIEQFGGDKILNDLLNTNKFDELADRLKRTAQSVKKIDLITNPSTGSPELTIESYGVLRKANTAGINNPAGFESSLLPKS